MRLSLWTAKEMVEAMGGRPVGDLPEGITGISIDSRTLAPGEAFFAIRGERFDGHDFASAAIAAGAGLLVVSEAKLPALGGLTVPLIVVDDVLDALGRLAAAARARSDAEIIAVTGSVGKTTTKEMLRACACAVGRGPRLRRLLQQSLGRAADAGAHAGRYALRRLRDRHEPRRARSGRWCKMVRPHIAIVTMIAAAHLGNFKDLDEIAARQGGNIRGRRAGRRRRHQPRQRQVRAPREMAAAGRGIERMSRIRRARPGRVPPARRHAPCRTGPTITVGHRGEAHDGTLGAPGRHIVQNALAVLGAASLTGADIARRPRGAGDDLRPEGPRPSGIVFASATAASC